MTLSRAYNSICSVINWVMDFLMRFHVYNLEAARISGRSLSIYLRLVGTFRREGFRRGHSRESATGAVDVITTSRSAAPLRAHLPNETETSARNKRYAASRALAITHVRSRYTFTCSNSARAAQAARRFRGVRCCCVKYSFYFARPASNAEALRLMIST